MRHPRLILFPGLAADARMFRRQQEAFPDLESPALPPPQDHESLAHFARRVARQIQADPPPFLGGVSFGAALALEVATHLPCRGVFLIGGLTAIDDVSLPLRLLLRSARFLPNMAVPPLLAFFPVALDLLEALEPHQRDLYVQMARDATPPRIRWEATALSEWRWTGALPVPVHHIHGADDYAVPPDNLKGATLVPRGRHLINLTHPAIVNRILRQRMTAIIQRETSHAPTTV